MMEWFLIYLFAGMPVSVWVMTYLHRQYTDVTNKDFVIIWFKSFIPIVREIEILMLLFDMVDDHVLFKRKQ